VRRFSETDVTRIADNTRVVLEDRGGAQLIVTADDVVADFLQVPSAIGKGNHLRVVWVGRDDGLLFERPGDQVAIEQDDLTLVRVAGLSVAPMLCVHVL
jgi:hypothetical protein